MLNNIKIILVNTTHPGNIGATARAMKTMGLQNLILANPFAKFPSAEVTARSAGADSVLENTRVTATVEEAIADCGLVIGTSAEERGLPLKRLTSRECKKIILEHAAIEKVAILFGTERSGLNNKELALCHRQVVIPANPEYNSLNLAAAVQIITYEIFMAAWAQGEIKPELRKNYDRLAKHEELKKLYVHLEQALIDINFLKPGIEKKLLPRLQRLFNRSCLEANEVNILRGILKKVQEVANKK